MMEYLLTAWWSQGERGPGWRNVRKIMENLWQEMRSSQPWALSWSKLRVGEYFIDSDFYLTVEKLSVLLFTLYLLRKGLCFISSELSSSQCHLLYGNLKKNHQALEQGREDWDGLESKIRHQGDNSLPSWKGVFCQLFPYSSFKHFLIIILKHVLIQLLSNFAVWQSKVGSISPYVVVQVWGRILGNSGHWGWERYREGGGRGLAQLQNPEALSPRYTVGNELSKRGCGGYRMVANQGTKQAVAAVPRQQEHPAFTLEGDTLS